jgi:hypothetical protein
MKTTSLSILLVLVILTAAYLNRSKTEGFATDTGGIVAIVVFVTFLTLAFIGIMTSKTS